MSENYDIDTLCGIDDDELTYRFREAVRIENEIKRIRKVPIAGYDPKKDKAYLLYSDGRIEYED